MPSGSPGVSHLSKSWQRPWSRNFSTWGYKPICPLEYPSCLPISPELHQAHLDRNRGTLTDCKPSAILLALPTECSDETSHQFVMLESSVCGFSGEEISLVFMEHNELQMSELSIFITPAFLWHLLCLFQACLGDSGVSLLSYQGVFWSSCSSTSTERKWNFASGMSYHKCFSGLSPSWSSCCSKIDPKAASTIHSALINFYQEKVIRTAHW